MLPFTCLANSLITSFSGPLKFASLLNICSPCNDSFFAALLASTSIIFPTLSSVPAFLALAATASAFISDLNCCLIAILIFNIFSKFVVISLSNPGKGNALGSTPSLTFANCAMLAASAVLPALQPFFFAAFARSNIT